MEKMSDAKIIMVLSLAGIIGAIITGISDVILLGRPVSALSFFTLGTESMADIDEWRIAAGVFIGIFTLPFQVLGLVSVYFGIRNAGKFLSFIVLSVFTHAMFISVAFHMGYAFIASGWKLYYRLGAENAIAAEIRDRFDFYWILMLSIMLAEMLIGSMLFVFIILRKKSLYSNWMVLLNPIFIFALMFLCIIIIPAPIGGFIAPAYLNLSMLTFIILSTLITIRKLKRYKFTKDDGLASAL